MQVIENPSDLCLRYVYQTNENVFLTGKAGTGKTTLLKKIIKESPKNTAVVAPTGIAALNAGGITIHSLFNLPFGTFIPDFGKTMSRGGVKLEDRTSLFRQSRFRKAKLKLLQELELLVIDEVSMLRADVLDAIDWILRSVRRVNSPFGGVQVLFIGDLLQLPPVCKNEEWDYLKVYYEGIYFFNALVLKENQPVYIELNKIYRQADNQFIAILNELRNNYLSAESVERLNQCYRPNFTPDVGENYITLTSHNRIADGMNTSSLNALKGSSLTYKASVKGDFPENIYPNDEKLQLKVGAQVMFIKNDSSQEKRFYNGKIGTISRIDGKEVFVYLKEEKKTIQVERYEWENVKYTVDPDTNEIKEKIVGTYVQFPLRLAWAITIHKSQGLTFEKAILDVSRVFAAGQAYVALSRLTTLDGLILKSLFQLNGIQNDKQILQYSDKKVSTEQLDNQFSDARYAYLKMRLIHAFDWSSLEGRWRKHLAFYKDMAGKSEKSKYLPWATEQFEKTKKMVDTSLKFVHQLNRLFDEKATLEFLEERMEKAYQHFYSLIDDLNYQVLRMRFLLEKIKRVKEFQEELEELDESQLALMIEMKRTKNFFQAIVHHQPLERTVVQSEDVQKYRTDMYLKIQEELKKNKQELDIPQNEGTSITELLTQKIKKVKTTKEAEVKPKKTPTQMITFELHKKGMNVSEIAKERMLVEETIRGHFIKLWELGLIERSEIIAEERVAFLQKGLANLPDELTFKEINEKISGGIAFYELKLMNILKAKQQEIERK